MSFFEGKYHLSESELLTELKCFPVEELKRHDYSTANGAMKAINNGAYLQLNPKNLPAESMLRGALQRLRVGEWRRGVRGLSDFAINSLVLIGKAGNGTGFHVDWSQASNIAMGLDLKKVTCSAYRAMCARACSASLLRLFCFDARLCAGVQVAYDPQKPLAWWAFIHPDAFAAAEAWVRAKVPGREQLGIAKAVLDLQSVKELQQALGGADKLKIVHQRAGHAVLVPPGWLHMVHNEQSCLKLAYDTYQLEWFPAYVLSWKRIAASMTQNAEDYQAVNDVVAVALAGASS